MPHSALLTVLAAPQLQTETPTWAPILFAVGAFGVVVVVLIMVRRKLKESEGFHTPPTSGSSGHQDNVPPEADDPDPRDDDPR